MRLLPGLQIIAGRHTDYHAFAYVLEGDRPLLVDTMVRGEPERVILPTLHEMGCAPICVLITHGHADHFGGLAEIVQAFPAIRVAAPGIDAPWIESVDRLLEEMYRGYARAAGFPVDEARIAWVRTLIGGSVPVAERLQPGDVVRTGQFELEVVHLPGHSPGHLGLLDSGRRFALVADALLGRGLPDREGRRPAAPMYSDVPAYRQTLREIRSWEIPLLLTSHVPPLRDEAANAFIDESERFVRDCEAAVIEALAAAGEGLPFVELAGRVGEALGPYPAGLPSFSAILAHLEELERQGYAARTTRNGTLVWARCT